MSAHPRRAPQPPPPAATGPLAPARLGTEAPRRPVPARLGRLAGPGLTLLAGAAVLAQQHRLQALRRRLASAQYEARHDRLTGLPGRRSALEHLSTAPVALLGLLDLDDFKSINDRYGHDTGDRLLVVIAQRLHTAMGGQGMAARLSGDEFALLWSPGHGDRLHQVGPLLAQVDTPVRIGPHLVLPRASLGLARPGPHLQGPALLAAADHAMYEAKRTGSRAHLYTGIYPPAPVDRRTGPDRRSPLP